MASVLAMPFSAQLARALREQSGLSRVEAARRIGISRQALSNIEDSGSVPGADTLAAMASVFGASLDDFIVHAPDHAMPGNGRGAGTTAR